MSMQLDMRLEGHGTRFKIFPQPRFLDAFSEPETIWVSPVPADMRPGPADDRIFVVDAVNKRPYDRFSGPPYLGSSNPPTTPGPGGHFDHLDVDSREFSCATMYATVRRVLDIWEDYFGHPLDLHLSPGLSQIELIPLIVWDNAQAGLGFMEFGFGRTSLGGIDLTRPYCQNFDVLAHELGHTIIFAAVGFPQFGTETDDYGGFHESCGDLVAINASLHFDMVVDHLLHHSKGNLFAINELSRVGELSASREIRIAFNNERMANIGTEPHDRSLPLTGAIFDVFVEVFQKELVGAGLISQSLADESNHTFDGVGDVNSIQAKFAQAYAGKHDLFKLALLTARDYLGRLLATTWSGLSPDGLTYYEISRALLRADRDVSGGAHQTTIRECFAWREITVPVNSLLAMPRRVSQCGIKDEVPHEAAPAAPAPGSIELFDLARAWIEHEARRRQKSKAK